MDEIKFLDLYAQYISVKKEIDSAIKNVIKHSVFIGGNEVIGFEHEFAEYIGVKHCISVNSGTDALILGLRALELPKNSEVIIPVNTFIATAIGALENGLKPVFVDCNEEYGMSLDDLKNKITPKTKAIIAVHLYGQPDNIDEIKKIIDSTGQPIEFIEDACQAHGAEYKGKKAGSFGHFSAFSFYPGKNLGAYGDSGAIVTNDSVLAKKLFLLREYGSSIKYNHETDGINSRMNTMQAAILRIKLRYLDDWNRKRQKIASMYSNTLNNKRITVPIIAENRTHVFHQYVIRVQKRDNFREYLKTNGIPTLIHYPIPLHQQKALQYLGYKPEDFPFANQLCKEICSIPIYPELVKKNLNYIISSINEY